MTDQVTDTHNTPPATEPAALRLSEGLGPTAEQQARDMLERMGVDDAQSFTAGDLVELANMIAHAEELEKWKTEGEHLFSGGGFAAAFLLGAWWADRPWRNRA